MSPRITLGVGLPGMASLLDRAADDAAASAPPPLHEELPAVASVTLALQATTLKRGGVNTPPISLLGTIASVVATALAGDTASLAFTPATNATQYRIRRQIDGGGFGPALTITNPTVDNNGRIALPPITGLTADKDYQWEVVPQRIVAGLVESGTPALSNTIHTPNSSNPSGKAAGFDGVERNVYTRNGVGYLLPLGWSVNIITGRPVETNGIGTVDTRTPPPSRLIAPTYTVQAAPTNVGGQVRTKEQQLQYFIDVALPGEKIAAPPGVYKMNLWLRNKNITSLQNLISIVSTEADQLPAGQFGGVDNNDPAQFAHAVVIEPTNAFEWAIQTEDGGCGFYLEGIGWQVVAGYTGLWNGLVYLAPQTFPPSGVSFDSPVFQPSDVARGPHHIWFNKCFGRSDYTRDLLRHVYCRMVRDVAFTNCDFDPATSWNDAQCILFEIGAQRVKVDNCRLPASGEPIMFGGGDYTVKAAQGADYQVTRCHFARDEQLWKSNRAPGTYASPSFKAGGTEDKHGLYGINAWNLAEGRLDRGTWPPAPVMVGKMVLQYGSFIAEKTAVMEWGHRIYMDNVIRNSGTAFDLLGLQNIQSNEGIVGHHVMVENNLCTGIEQKGFHLQSSGFGVFSLQILNNSIDAGNADAIYIDGDPSHDWELTLPLPTVIKNNLTIGAWTAQGTGWPTQPGPHSAESFYDRYDVPNTAGNVVALAGWPAAYKHEIPGKIHVVDTEAGMAVLGVRNYAAGDLKLMAGSPALGQGENSTNPGCYDIDALLAVETNCRNRHWGA